MKGNTLIQYPFMRIMYIMLNKINQCYLVSMIVIF